MSNLAVKTEKGPLVFVWAIILFISSLFMPIVFISWIQDLLFYSKSHWFFVAPQSAYVAFMIGMAWIPIVMIVYLIMNYKYELKFLKMFSLLIASLSIPVMIFSATTYYYFDDNGLHYNRLESFNQLETYEWESFKEVKKNYAKRQNTTYLKEYIFILKDDLEIAIPYEGDIRHNEYRLMDKLNENNVTITDNYMDQYE
ncbi:hypothetical protein D1B31_14000 [Neobacillus notoginsengisoli]|uniref:Uncharacterized protein n=1 Tax=Neobacillus notoginsengisoli TaxID=1578198 RepID=A0A417YSW1_9BACI|nr:hypothetical protein [Neobacillus notoginsengisoli]RHW39069.1 hypothetical protein D1B31_14000 [Neobacillus notoginsengisoli]